MVNLLKKGLDKSHYITVPEGEHVDTARGHSISLRHETFQITDVAAHIPKHAADGSADRAKKLKYMYLLYQIFSKISIFNGNNRRL